MESQHQPGKPRWGNIRNATDPNTKFILPAPRPITQPLSIRKKDRISYAHQSFKIDLTQVTSATGPTAGASGEVTHELELEFLDSSELMKFAKLRGRGPGGPGAPGPSAVPWSGKENDMFDELVRVFVNNIRILVRNAA